MTTAGCSVKKDLLDGVAYILKYFKEKYNICLHICHTNYPLQGALMNKKCVAATVIYFAKGLNPFTYTCRPLLGVGRLLNGANRLDTHSSIWSWEPC